MNFFEIISLAKVFSQISNGNMTLSELELETASRALKQLGDNRQDWSTQQKEIYKSMVDYAKNISKNR